jgi:hypothetical protein
MKAFTSTSARLTRDLITVGSLMPKQIRIDLFCDPNGCGLSQVIKGTAT